MRARPNRAKLIEHFRSQERVLPSDPAALIRLCYVSEAALPTGEDTAKEIQAILNRSRWWNHSVGITGSLFFNHSLFAQMLEGPSREVERLFDQIRLDPRHRNVIRIDWRAIKERQFPEWSMAFVGAEAAPGSPFSDLVLDERRAADLPRDNMLGLLVNIVRNREAGISVSTRCDEAALAMSVSR